MRAMILAAGRGERMMPLTQHTPKPLLIAAGKSLIERIIMRLVSDGITKIVINHAYLGQQIENALGDGSKFGASIYYSPEGEKGFETAGGIIHALPLLGKEPFLVVNADIATDFPFHTLRDKSIDLAHLILVANPIHHPQGDFHLNTDNTLSSSDSHRLTFSGIGLYSPELFQQAKINSAKLAPILREAMLHGRVTGEYFDGFWMDIGTPARLEILEKHLLAT
jgi:MurNAc alpha-1-phosphate uridylyltransferase